MRGKGPVTRDRTYWTKQRVIAGLKLFHKAYGFTPTASEHYHSLTRYTGMTRERDFPSAYAVMRWFASFRQAWEAAGILTDRSHEPWSDLEDWYLWEATGILPRFEIARDLRRTEGSVKRRLYDLGIDARTRWGWSIHRVAEHTQIPGHLFDGYLYRGELPYFRGNKFIYIDPADLLGIDIIDWRSVTRELKNAVRRSLMDRAVKILSGIDWRRARPHRPHSMKKTDRVYKWSRKYASPGTMPYKLKRGDVVEVKDSDRKRQLKAGRRGVVHLVMWKTYAEEPCWMARVEFKRSRSSSNPERRAIYTLPLTRLRRVRRKKEDPVIPEQGLVHSPTRVWYGTYATARGKAIKLKRDEKLRKERMQAEAERMRKRAARRRHALQLTGPYRGRSSGGA